MAIDYPVAVPTLIGSILSALGSGFILVCYAFLPQKHHFRHALIINLAISDFFNAFNNSVSGLITITSNHDLHHGTFCTVNGWLGQFTVQATDISILAIAIITLLTLTRKIAIPDNAVVPKVLVCLSVWIVPTITSFTALGLGYYQPVSGNWCWIKPDPTFLRYVLTHGWRFLVILLSSGIYIYVYVHLYKHFQQFKNISASWQSERKDSIWPEDPESERMNSVSFRKGSDQESAGKRRGTQANNPGISKSEAMIKRTLLLNAYPIAYIILWIPGIANRIAEATNHPSQILAVAQASTQFVGLANAITYGINERVLIQLKDVFSGRRPSIAMAPPQF